MITDEIRVVDTDTHIVEPPDLWTARVPKKWHDIAPHLEFDDEFGEDRWVVNGVPVSPVGYYAMAGWREPVPSHPLTLDEADPAVFDPVRRLERMDEYGIYAAVLYPNVISFNGGLFMNMPADAALACTQAYNDFQSEFAAADRKRLIPLAVLPFWDVAESVRELTRCHGLGHRGVVFSGKQEQAGLPHFTNSHWDPLYAAAQDLGMSINFHAGFDSRNEVAADAQRLRHRSAMSSRLGRGVKTSRQRAQETAMGVWPANAETISHIVTSGLCDRFPNLKFVSVESGFGYLPYLIESLDWHWRNYGVPADAPGSMLPSEYFRRQVYATFWFERTTLPLLHLFADNMMFETDYPHPTSLSPGPYSVADSPKVHIESAFADVGPDVRRKVLEDNARAVYHLD